MLGVGLRFGVERERECWSGNIDESLPTCEQGGSTTLITEWNSVAVLSAPSGRYANRR